MSDSPTPWRPKIPGEKRAEVNPPGYVSPAGSEPLDAMIVPEGVLPRALPPQYAPVIDARRSKKAIWSLVLGVLSLLFSIFTGIIAIILGILALRDISNGRGALKGRGMAITGLILGLLGIVVMPAIIFPALVQVIAVVRETQSKQALTDIGKALQQWSAEHGDAGLPGDSVSPDGEPLLSWRVHILPQLGEKELYDQFHLDEPWDSPHNKRLVDKIPKVYRAIPPGQPDILPGHTAAVGVAGAAIAFQEPEADRHGVRAKRGPRMGMSPRLIVAIDASNVATVPWTSPGDWQVKQGNFDEIRSFSGLGNVIALMSDGSVEVFSSDTTDDRLQDLLGVDVVNRWWRLPSR